EPRARRAGGARGGLLARRAGPGGRGGLAQRHPHRGHGEGPGVVGGRRPHGASRGSATAHGDGLSLARRHPRSHGRRNRRRRRRGAWLEIAGRGPVWV
ncbi:MAG: hypothetical protein AVDCRST_MAG80-1572, partial [uncultured Rubrobacteraceae bacterium]